MGPGDWKTSARAAQSTDDCQSTDAFPRTSRQTLYRRAAVPEHERRSRTGILRRRHGRGHHHGSVAVQVAIRDRPKLLISSTRASAVDIKQVGRELGVRYVLEGSVRNAGGKVRITGQLIDSETDMHLWADRFEGSMEDVFELQDDVTRKVVEAMAPRVEQAEIARVKRRPPGNPRAYDCYLRGLACLSPVTIESLGQALRLFTEASVLDPEFSPAYGMAMCCHGHRVGFGLVENKEQEKAEVARLWRMVARVGKDDSVALGQAGYAVAFVYRDLPAAKELIDRAVSLNPSLASAWGSSGWINLWQGRPDTALDHLGRAERLDPGQAGYATWRSAMAHAHFYLGQYDEALALVEQMLLHSPNAHPVLRIGTASAAFGARTEEAHRLAGRLQDVDALFRVSRLREYLGPIKIPSSWRSTRKGYAARACRNKRGRSGFVSCGCGRR